MQDSIQFSAATVQIEQKLSETLFVAKDSTNTLYHLKKYPRPSEFFKTELSALRSIGFHSHLVSLLDTLEDTEHSYLLLEYSGTPLGTYTSQEPLSQQQISLIFREIGVGLNYIHSKDYTHRNLSPESIFVFPDLQVKIGNFSSAICLSDLSNLYGIELSENIEAFVSQEYRAPEMIDLSRGLPIGREIDLWGLGCTLAYVLTGLPAFSPDQIEDQLKGKFMVPPSVKIPNVWKSLIPRLLCPDPLQRATIADIFKAIEEPPAKNEQSIFSQLSGLFGKSTKKWVKLATVENESAPDNIYINKLISKAWKKPFKIVKVVKAFSQRPLQKSTVALKAIIVIHKYINTGPKAVFSSDLPSVINKLRGCWTAPHKPAKNDKHANEYLLEIINLYASLLEKKIQLHKDTSSTGIWTECDFSVMQCLELLNFWKDILHLNAVSLEKTTTVSEIFTTLLLMLIEEQQRLSTGLSVSISKLLSIEEMTELTSEYQDRQDRMLEIVSVFRAKYPFAYLPPQVTNDNILQKKRRSTLPLVFEQKPKIEHNFVSESPMSLENSAIIDLNDTSQWLIDHISFKKQEVIGVGSSCTVYKGSFNEHPVAIKVMRTTKTSVQKEFDRELQVLATLQHPNLVQFLGACLEPEMCILTEFCTGDTLFGLLHENTHIKLSWAQKFKMAKDIAQGMAYLHEQNPPYIHRDLKSLNLLLAQPVKTQTDSVLVKITDFGVSRVIDEGELMTGQMGTCHWMAPEVLESKPYSLAADVFSFGIVLWEIVSRETPYRGISPAMIPYHVINLGTRPDMTLIPPTCPDSYKNLITRSIDTDPQSRPTFREILEVLNDLIN